MKLIMIVAVYLCIFEVASLAFWELYGAKRIPYHERVEASSADFVHQGSAWRDHLSAPDIELGWLPNTEHEWVEDDGSRSAPMVPVRQRISAYGDSFVFGADVKNEEAFPHQLSLLVGSRVQNFGVGSYGPDQAVLFLERHLRNGERPEIVILGMPSENIARVVNVIRRFYIPQEGVQFYKPLFVAKGKEWRLVGGLPKWPPEAWGWDQLLSAAREHDIWYAQNGSRPRFEFPYSLTTLQAAWFLSFGVLRWQELYQDERAVATMRYLLDRFAGLSKEFGFLPVFVIVPMPEDLLELRSGKNAFFSAFLREASREHRDDLIVVDVLDAEFDMERFHVRPFSGHASAYGNQIIAQAIYSRLLVAGAIKD